MFKGGKTARVQTMSDADARNRVEVRVDVMHSPAHSEPERLFYVYFIRIHNTGSNRVQVLRRHWVIRAANGDRQEVDAEGVIGQKPILEPDGTFDYHSGVPIVQAPGNMSGFYTCRDLETGEFFSVPVPAFDLPVPENAPVVAEVSSPVERMMN